MPQETGIKEMKSFIVKVLIVIVLFLLSLFAVYLLGAASGVLLLVFLGILLGAMLDGMAGLLRRYLKLPRKLAVIASVLILLMLVVATGWFIGPRLGEQMTELSRKIPEAAGKVQDMIINTSWGKALVNMAPSAKEAMPSAPDIIGYLTGFFSSTFTLISNIVIMFFIGIYLAIDPGLYVDNLIMLFPASKRERARTVLHYCMRALKWWLVGRFSSMAVVGILTALGLWIIGVKTALSLGIIAALFSFIPFLGPFLSFIPAFLISFLQDPALSYSVILVYIIVQSVESYFLTPLIDQKTVSNPPALLITIQLLMGVLTGPIGVILASPLVVVVIILIQTVYVEGILGSRIKVMGDQSSKSG
ncbi:MAG TPA: AI-2E family transporter [Ignavibacteriales bacterium]|nr:AI-2E family transporter [Ignavibacteriales bacterium]